MLFAQMDFGTTLILWVLFMAFGLRQWAIWLGGGNNAVGQAARKGIVSLLTRWLK